MADAHEHNHIFPRLDNSAYSREVKKTLIFVLVLNWLVSVAKLIVGYLIGSASLIADGYHSFADGASNIIGLVGMKIACQPKDKDHPYGHKKYETFASLLIAFLLFILCFHIVHDSFERLHTSRAPQVNLFSFGVLFVTLIVNICVMLYEYRKGKAIGSDVLVSDSLHTRSDILTSLSVIFAFIGIKLGFPVLDSLAALVIVVFIGLAAINILRETSNTLCDTAVIDPGEVEKKVLEVEGVKRCHHVRTRGRKDDIYVDLHVLMDDKTPLFRAHDVSSKIEKKVKDSFGGVSDVIVHIEPLSSDGDHHDEGRQQ
jgi:cation diffusion facilitator family transporter